MADKSKRMFLAMKKRTNNKPPIVRNQAVQAVGEPYFQIAMTGLMVAAILAIVTIAMGESKTRKKRKKPAGQKLFCLGRQKVLSLVS